MCERDDGHPVSITHLYGLEERQDHRVHVAPEYRIHHPLLEMLALDAGDGSVVLHPEEDHAALKVGQRDALLGELLRAHVVALELHAGALAVLDQFEQVGFRHAGFFPKRTMKDINDVKGGFRGARVSWRLSCCSPM
jgi:hypothetical protein